MGRAAKFTRIGLYSLLTMLGLVLLLWLAGWLLLPGLIQKELTRYGEKIGYRVSADAVSIAPLQLKASIEGLHIAPLAETKAAEAAQANPEPERSKTTERRRVGKKVKAAQKKAAKEKAALAVEVAPASTNNDDSLLKLGKISTQVRFWPLLSGQVSVMDVVLDSPTILLSRGEGAKAEWNWARFVNALSKLSGPEPEKPEQPEKPSTLKISVDAVRINNARLLVQNGRWHDEFGPLTLVVDGYRNQGDDGKVGGMALSYALNLGKLSVPVGQTENGRVRELLLNEVRLKGGVHRRVDQMFRIDVDLTVDEGTIASQWEIDPAKAAIKASLKIDKVPLAPFIAVVPANQPLQAKSGNLNGELSFSLIERVTHLAGQLAVNDLAVYAGESKDILLGWEKTQVNGLDYTQPPSDAKTPATLRLGEITLTRLQSRFELDKQHVSNFGHLFGAAKPAAAAKDAQTGQADTSVGSVKEAKDSKDAAPGLRYDIRAIRLSQGRLYFADHSIQPDFMVNINTLNGFVLGISNAPGRVGSLALDGRVGPYGSLRGRGQLALTDPKMNNNVTLSFKNIPLNSTNPYAMTFAGYKIDSGSMDADLGYVTKAGQLQGSNRFVIRKIKIGDEVPDYQGTRLPLKLAVALLEDSDGMIELNIPVQGNVNDPQFGVGALVWQAFKTILTNAITAPFRLIGNLLGIEHGDVIDFVPGESSLLPAEQEKLQKIAGVLAKRPKAKLVVHGTYDASADTAALARATTDRAILAAAGIKVGVGEPLPEPNLTDPAVQSAVKSVYGSQIGRIKLAQRLLTLPDTVARYQQLRDELIQNVSINEVQLKQLAASRAQLAQSLVLGANKDPAFAARVVIGDTTTVSADDKGVALKVDIERID